MSITPDRKRLSAIQRRSLLSTPAGWLASGLGAGLVPCAQGSFGSMVALLPWLGLCRWTLPVYLGALVLAFGIGWWACEVAGKALGVDDHRALVWDEFVGQWIALLPLLGHASIWGVGLGFLLFRLFDIAKPWPIGALDRRLKGGLGVMVDDVAAGGLAAVCLALGRYLGL